MLPNFLIIGQMKAGTTSLHAYLRQHPQVFMPDLKELRFFSERIDDPNRRSYTPKGLPATLEEYEQLFDNCGGAIAIGEASPEYLQSQHAPHQIHTHLPHVRLIVSLRRPEDRLYSMYLMRRRIGRENRTFVDAFQEGREERWFTSNFTYAAMQRYYNLFERDRIFPLRFEDLVTQPLATVRQVLGFVGVDHNREVDTSEVYNEGGVWKRQWLGGAMTALRANRPLMQQLKRIVPRPAWQMAKRIHNGNIVRAPAMSAEMRNEVAALFVEDTRRLQELVRLDLSSWLV